MKPKFLKPLLALILGLMAFFPFNQSLQAQQIMLDKMIQAGELKLFPTLEDPNAYYYLADKISVARHNDGKPMFMFIKYVRNQESEGAGSSTITESNQAGGIVHAVVSLEVPEEMLRKSRQALRRFNSSGKIMGPVMYKSGTIAIISSFADPKGEETKKVVGIGTAPILEGQKAAISVQLNKEGSDILWATFQTPTPDFSVSFEMEVEGYLSPKKVKIEADFERMYSNQTFEAAAVTPVLSAEINLAFDELRDQGAIKVTQIGEDEGLEKIMETAYNKLTNLMFDKIGGTGVPQLNQILPGGQKSMLDRATEQLANARKEVREDNQRREENARNQSRREQNLQSQAQAARTQRAQSQGRQAPPTPTRSGANSNGNGNDNNNDGQQEVQQQALPGLAVAVSYRMKKVKRSGKYVIDLNKYTTDTRTMRFDENLGSVTSCKECFERVNLDDPLYKQRDIHARVDGMNAQDFGSYINSVNVVMRKKHENGQETVKEILVNKELFNEEGNDFVMQYGWKGDDNRSKWLEYEYKTRWSFFGDLQMETDWRKDVFGGLALAPPLVRKPIYIEADPDFFAEERIRAAEVNISYTVNGKTMKKKVKLKTRGNELSSTVDVILPPDSDTYTYQVTWFKRGSRPIQTAPEETNYGSIYLDFIPE